MTLPNNHNERHLGTEMLIRVVEKEGDAPRLEGEGVPVWLAGHQNQDTDDNDVPASALAALIPDLEIGSWYRWTELRPKLANVSSDEHDVWTTVKIEQMGIDGAFTTKLEISNGRILKMLCEGTVSHLDRFSRSERLWVRFE